jgi:hypothetical protein
VATCAISPAEEHCRRRGCRGLLVAAVLGLLASAAFSAPPPKTAPAPKPTEVKIVSVPAAAQPTEVKVTSMPAAQTAEVKVTSMPTPQLTEVKVKDIPTDPWNIGLVCLTACLVIANFALCFITIRISRSQREDTRQSMLIAERMANAAEVSADANRLSAQATVRDRRVALEREVGVSAHRLAVQARLVQNMINELRTVLQSNFIFAGQAKNNSSRAKMYDDIQQERTSRITTVSGIANQVVEMPLGGKSEDDLVSHLKDLDGLAAEIEALKEQVRDDLGIARAYLERQQRRQEDLISKLNPLDRR